MRDFSGQNPLILPPYLIFNRAAKTADEWDDDDEHDDEQRLVQALQALLATDCRREVNLGRYLPNEDPYLVR
jgi:hypothetical protein